jgi:hypothetical protein
MSTSAKRPRSEERPRAVSVAVRAGRLRVELADGREVSAPLSWFPRLQAASPKARAKWRMIGAGSGIHWPEVDEDVSVASLLGLPSD